jgi:hypothetical protein
MMIRARRRLTAKLLVSFPEGETAMTVQEELVRAAAAPTSAAPPSALWWQSQSCEELRAIASRGIHGGDLYFAAMAELERRAHDCEVEIEHQHEEVAAQHQYTVWWLAVLVAAIAVGLTARLLGY